MLVSADAINPYRDFPGDSCVLLLTPYQRPLVIPSWKIPNWLANLHGTPGVSSSAFSKGIAEVTLGQCYHVCFLIVFVRERKKVATG